MPSTFIAHYITKSKPDVFVLNEFIKGVGFNDFKNNLKDYQILTPDYIPKKNSICIGVKKNIQITGEFTQMDNVAYTQMPDFYRVDIKINNNDYHIIGTRIKICFRANEHENRYIQF